MRVRVALVAAVILLSLVPAPASADVQVQMAGAETDVREEDWKDEPTIDSVTGDGLPQTPVASGVYSNPYFNASRSHSGTLGHYLGVTVELPGISSDPASPDAGRYVVTAEIQVRTDRTIKAKLTKESPNTFLAEFDLDGSQAEEREPLPPGVFDLAVEVYRVSTDPLHGAERVGSATFPVKNDPGRPVSGYASLFPVDHLRKWQGLGGLRHAPMMGQTPTDGDLSVGFNFPASSGVSAAVTSYVATRRTPGGGPGDVVVDRTPLTSETTTDAGTIRAEFAPSDVLGSKDGDLIVVAAYLAGDSLDIGASLLVIPASDASSLVTGYTPTELSGPANQQTDGFEVSIQDESGGSNSADSVALFNGGTLIAQARLVRSEAGGGDRYFANYAYEDIREDSPTTYMIYTLLYESTDQDTHEFHSLAVSRRGLTATIPFDQRFPVQEGGEIPVQVRSAYTNGNSDQEIGFLLDATVEVTGLPDQGTYTKRATINESAGQVVEIPWSPSPPDTYILQVNVSAAEVATAQTVTVTVPEGPGGPAFTPGFEAALVLAAVALVALWTGQRRRSDGG